MMVPIDGTEAEFAAGVDEWIAAHLVGEYLDYLGVGGIADDSHWEIRLEWEKELAGAGLLNISWPEVYGGRNGSTVHDMIVMTALARARAPYWSGVQGRDLLGPMLIANGSEALKLRFLPPITRCEQFWGQGFSEPDAGSDLAGVRTRARLDGDEWVVDGQKMWMTFGMHADWLYVLCRTSDAEPRHRGLSMLLVPRNQPGVEVRSVRNMAGGEEFAEVFFNGARTDGDLVVGAVDEGWRVAMSTLGIERGPTMIPYLFGAEQEMLGLIATARALGLTADANVRQQLARSVSRFRTIRQMVLAVVDDTIRGIDPGARGVLVKSLISFWHRDLGELAMSIFGADAMIDPHQIGAGPHHLFLNTRAETIYGGSAEIQHNIIAERVLGLPKG